MGSEKAKQYHSIVFTNEFGVRKNSWDDWFLIPSSRPLIAAPEPKTQYIDIPGAHGTIDASEVISDTILYSDRTGSWNFIVANNSCVTDEVPEPKDGFDWYTRYTDILEFLQGKLVSVYLEDNPNKIYKGRITVDWNSDPQAGYSNLTMSYTFRPLDSNGHL